MCTQSDVKRYKYRVVFLEVSRNIKYIGIFSILLTFYFDSVILSVLSLFALFGIAELFLNFSVFKAGILQFLGMITTKIRYGKNAPSINSYESEIEYSLPFEGKWIVVNGSYAKEQSHSWSIQTQRYAYDFVIVDDKGKTFQNKLDEPQNYYCYDEKILAPADGEVVEVYNKAQDSVIFNSGKFLQRSSHIAGNYIVIKHTENEDSTLAHLRENSICVKRGDKVLRGQTIAKCGNTGHSTEPHLHFQIQNGKSFYYCIGLPIKFRSIRIETPPIEYNKIDLRPAISKENIEEGYITRGYVVYNSL